MLSGQENPKVVAGWMELDYFRRPRRRRRIYLWAITGAIVLGGLFVAMSLVPPSRSIYHAGSLSTAHAMFETSCEQCHVTPFQTARRLWTADDRVRSVPQEACLRCHDGAVHHEDEVGTCVTCHKEHRGRIALAQVPDKQCTPCHANLLTKAGQPKVQARSIRAFHTDHPDFTPQANPGTIRFNHKMHLNLPEEQARGFAPAFGHLKQQGCAFCHETKRARDDGLLEVDLEQRYPSPLNYDRHCSSCHPLSIGLPGQGPDAALQAAVVEFAAKPVLHPRKGETAQAIRDAVRGRLLELVARHPDLADAKPAARSVSRLPDRQGVLPITPSEEAWAEQQLHAVERELFDGAAGCRYCHQEATQPRARPGGLPQYAPPGIPTRWFGHSRFHHASHRMLQCIECHAMQQSERPSDVRMPTIATCRSCHGPGGGARSDCVECHTYHDRTRDRGLMGNMTINDLDEW